MFDFDEIEEDAQKSGGWKEGDVKESEADVNARITAAISAAGDDIDAQEKKRLDDLAAEEKKRLAKEKKRAQHVLPAMPSSPWIGVTRRNESALIRLYVLLGVGAPAQSYAKVCSVENYATYPDIEICVLELPGHGENPPPAFHNPGELADAVAKVIADLQFHKQTESDMERPFALFGFSLGSPFMWNAARKVCGKHDEKCSKLYVAGRGAPHVGVNPTSDKVEQKRPNLSSKPIDEVLDFSLTTLTSIVDPAQVEKYRGYLGYLKKKDPEKLVDFAETLVCDTMVSTPALISADDTAPVDCPTQFWYSEADDVWPLQRKDAEVASAAYESLLETWRPYAPRDGFTATKVAPLGHGDLGGPDSPLFTLALEDLSKIAAGIVK